MDSPSKLKRFLNKNRDTVSSYAILAIPLLWWAVFFLYPFFRTVILSFSNYSTMEDFAWVGLDNYIELFKDPTMGYAFRNTTIWCFVMLIGTNFFGLALAFLLTNMKSAKLEKLFLGLLYWPSLVSAVVGSSMQLSLFGSDETGIINSILLKWNWIAQPIAWFQDARIALLSLMIYPFVFGFGLKMLLYYVSIKNIPKNYYEAASIETNSKVKVFLKITLPLLSPIILLNVVMSIIDGFKVIAPMQLIIPAIGGPENETVSVVYALYREAFEKSGNRVGYASAISMVLFLIILIITAVQFKLQKENYSYD